MSDLDSIVRENIRIVAQVITELCQRSTRELVCDVHLSRNQYYILKILETSGPHQISDFARILDISAAAASKNIDRLAQIDFVERHASTRDRRRQDVHLRPAGRRVVEDFDRVTAEKQAPMLKQFSSEEKTQLLDLLQRVLKFTLDEGHDMDLICLQCGGRCGPTCVVKDGAGICPRFPRKTLTDENP